MFIKPALYSVPPIHGSNPILAGAVGAAGRTKVKFTVVDSNLPQIGSILTALTVIV
jgi:hypothetical protein